MYSGASSLFSGLGPFKLTLHTLQLILECTLYIVHSIHTSPYLRVYIVNSTHTLYIVHSTHTPADLRVYTVHSTHTPANLRVYTVHIVNCTHTPSQIVRTYSTYFTHALLYFMVLNCTVYTIHSIYNTHYTVHIIQRLLWS